ncbi:uncharacterized protein SCHCODRAFT_02665708 [Schizophyllum commune H4-8]|uniref:Uncharacterized protein n=1 Tax=Schizophyllum commune (strain H4-8 / FGSC 9210) TaxID=578458 RepID=D8Q1B6_SCHCM|nr:uncharacterized protein SCHCODRAFT_02665708 [Schizophyllum commune H4-8]KAI5895349.1 hypothetical protein SCHCODRAFT_02665708 [Schizophyllum commune H4-8]
MAGGVHSSVLLAARGSDPGVDPSPKSRGAAADEAQTMHARSARVRLGGQSAHAPGSSQVPSTCRLGAQASCMPDEPEPALTSARGWMIAGSLERTDKMPARAEVCSCSSARVHSPRQGASAGGRRDVIARMPGASGRIAHCSHSHGHVEPVLLNIPRWLLTDSFTPCGSPQLQRTAPKVRGPPGLRGLPGSTSRQFCARQAQLARQENSPSIAGAPSACPVRTGVHQARRCANSVPIPTVCGRPGKPLVLFANRAGA